MSSPDDLRNPYGVLGLPFGASVDEASRAFARRARGLRGTPGADERLTELTWALRRVEEIGDDAQSALEVYRVPADPEALGAPDARGVLNPVPYRLQRQSGSPDGDWAELLDQARHEARRAVLAEVATNASLPDR